MAITMMPVISALFAEKAGATVTVSSGTPTFTFYVPETIYLNPSDNKTFQYYVDRRQSVNSLPWIRRSLTSPWSTAKRHRGS